MALAIFPRVFLVVFDCSDVGRAEALLKALGGRQLLDRAWLLRAPGPASLVRDALYSRLKEDPALRLLAVEFSTSGERDGLATPFGDDALGQIVGGSEAVWAAVQLLGNVHDF